MNDRGNWKAEVLAYLIAKSDALEVKTEKKAIHIQEFLQVPLYEGAP
jgi:hypothetical protein